MFSLPETDLFLIVFLKHQVLENVQHRLLVNLPGNKVFDVVVFEGPDKLCLLSLVEILCLAWQNDAVRFLYLSFSVSPMYVSVVLLSLRVRYL